MGIGAVTYRSVMIHRLMRTYSVLFYGAEVKVYNKHVSPLEHALRMYWYTRINLYEEIYE